MVKAFRPLGPYLKPFRFRYAAGIFALIVASGAQLFIPLRIKYALDALPFLTGDPTPVLIEIAWILGLSIGTLLGRLFWRLLIIGSSREVEMELRSSLFRHIMGLGPGFFEKQKVGDLLARLTNDLLAVRMSISMAIVALLDGIFMTLSILIIMVQQNAVITLLTITPLPLITMFIIFASKRVGKMFKEVQEGFSTLSSISQDIFANIKMIKSFVKESYSAALFLNANHDYQGRNLKLVRLWGIFFPLVAFLSSLTIVILLGVGGQAALRLEFSAGDIVASISYLQMLVWPMIGAGFTVNILQRGAASMGRIQEIFSVEPEIVVPPNSPELALDGSIKVEDLTYRYPDDQEPTIQNVTMDIAPGSIVAITGPTGGGKSTLLKAMGGLLPLDDPQSVRYSGYGVHRIAPESLRTQLAFVSQNNFLFSDTIEENIRFGIVDDSESSSLGLEEAVATSGLKKDLAIFSDGLSTMVGERGVTLSGGQKQRVSLARGLITNPEILFLDDSLSSVDAETEAVIVRHLLEGRKGKTTVLVTHRVAVMEQCHQLAVMEKGRVSFFGDPKKGMEENDFLYHLKGIQQPNRPKPAVQGS